MTFVTSETRLADIGRRSSFFLRSRARLTYELQSRGMNSRLREEISSSSRHNSHPTNIVKLCQKGREREQEREREIPFPYTSPPILYNRDSLRWKEINAIHGYMEQQNVLFSRFYPENIVYILFLIYKHPIWARVLDELACQHLLEFCRFSLTSSMMMPWPLQ